MGKYKSILITIPVICALLALNRFGMFFRFGVPILPKCLFVAGIASILFSDTIIAFKEFSGYKELNFLIMPTYYLSHILMTLQLIRNTNSKIKMNSKIMTNLNN